MRPLLDHPTLLCLSSLIVFWLVGLAGYGVQKLARPLRRDEQDEYKIVEGACLTLLGLIIGFSFAMAVNRYDLRKNMEESEANAIGTQYVRAELLPAPAAGALKKALKSYLDRRIAFYAEQDPALLAEAAAHEAKLQAEIWSIVRDSAAAQPTPIVALVVAGANDVLNAQGYALAAWRNRIPIAAWALMAIIAGACSAMLGFGSQRFNAPLLLVLPATIAISFLLIAEIDSPRGGFIRVLPANLAPVAQSLAQP
ncbi:hypothetical protein [Rhodoblastus sp.]|uniref:bestrophin-like domain n=1 Tax=Rhodoblastus sp. TaxID=1962975 RepID=UPI0035B3B567